MKRLGLSLVLILAFLQPTSAQAGSPYDGPPSDIKSFEKTLLESIATISCTYKKGIGFFGTYTLSQESKDKGYNSLIVTNQSLINDCIRNSGGAITIGFNGKNYNSVYSGFNVDGTDLATVISSLSPPEISLYDNYWPKIGSWVYVAYFVESFGIIFRSSRVQLINETTYVIAIDGITPAPTYGGLVFNSAGNFVGTVAMMGPGTAPSGMLKVHGAPLQCEIPGAERGTITRCSEGTRGKIWTIDAPSSSISKPTPIPTTRSSSTPTPTPTTASRELTSAQLLGFQAIQRFESAYESCESEFEKFDEDVLELISDFNFLALCNSLDSELEDLRIEIEDFDLRASNVSQGVATLGRLASSVDGLTRELSGIKFDVTSSRSTISTYAKTISETQGWFDLMAETWPELENRVSALPKTAQTMIKKNINFKKAIALADDLESRSEQLSEIESSASSATSLSELKNAVNDALKLKSTLKGYQEFPTTLKAIDKLIPAYVCTKGSLVANLPKTGKCAPGYAKVSTK
jgi:hypothetical protein